MRLNRENVLCGDPPANFVDKAGEVASNGIAQLALKRGLALRG
jgi:hypothetical protein